VTVKLAAHGRRCCSVESKDIVSWNDFFWYWTLRFRNLQWMGWTWSWWLKDFILFILFLLITTNANKQREREIRVVIAEERERMIKWLARDKDTLIEKRSGIYDLFFYERKGIVSVKKTKWGKVDWLVTEQAREHPKQKQNRGWKFKALEESREKTEWVRWERVERRKQSAINEGYTTTGTDVREAELIRIEEWFARMLHCNWEGGGGGKRKFLEQKNV